VLGAWRLRAEVTNVEGLNLGSLDDDDIRCGNNGTASVNGHCRWVVDLLPALIALRGDLGDREIRHCEGLIVKVVDKPTAVFRLKLPEPRFLFNGVANVEVLHWAKLFGARGIKDGNSEWLI